MPKLKKVAQTRIVPNFFSGAKSGAKVVPSGAKVVPSGAKKKSPLQFPATEIVSRYSSSGTQHNTFFSKHISLIDFRLSPSFIFFIIEYL